MYETPVCLLTSCVTLLQALLGEQGKDARSESEQKDVIERLFLFSMIW